VCVALWAALVDRLLHICDSVYHVLVILGLD
jgi:hypothetical protein